MIKEFLNDSHDGVAPGKISDRQDKLRKKLVEALRGGRIEELLVEFLSKAASDDKERHHEKVMQKLGQVSRNFKRTKQG